jgi:hypothetical protein
LAWASFFEKNQNFFQNILFVKKASGQNFRKKISTHLEDIELFRQN